MPDQSRTSRSDARGRHAESPTQIPAKGWKDVAWRIKERINKDSVMLVAGGVAFYILLALIPGLTALVSIYGLFFDPQSVQQQITALAGFIPEGGMEIVGGELERITSQPAGTLGFAFAISLAIALWSANAGVKAMFEAMNIAYGEYEKRSFIKLNLVSLAFTLSLIAAVIAISALLLVLPFVMEVMGFGELGKWLVRIAGLLLLAVAAIGGLAALYRWGPSRDTAEWTWITPGSILTLVVWVIASAGFTWYAANLGSYNATYGSLGSVIAFLFWIWITCLIVIIGAELNAELEHQTTHDTTKGEHEPMGRRGAHVADTMGESKVS